MNQILISYLAARQRCHSVCCFRFSFHVFLYTWCSSVEILRLFWGCLSLPLLSIFPKTHENRHNSLRWVYADLHSPKRSAVTLIATVRKLQRYHIRCGIRFPIYNTPFWKKKLAHEIFFIKFSLPHTAANAIAHKMNKITAIHTILSWLCQNLHITKV